MNVESTVIELEEYVPKRIPASIISREEGERLWHEFGKKISISEPNFQHKDSWELISLGWVGFIPFSDELSLYLRPKISLKNLFGMWEYAYRLKSLEILPEVYQCGTLQEFYEQLANTLARKILDRSRKGYYRAYVPRTEDLSFIRGRLDVKQMVMKPWEINPHCDFQEHTADVVENQILAWTLNTILRSGFCTERVLPTLRSCYRNIAQATSLQPFQPKDCVARFYNRLNQDYQPLHGLCRFFLENSGPSYEVGDHSMLPFLFDMAALFELFVAEWLRIHLPPQYGLRSKETIVIGEEGLFKIEIDLVIFDAVSNRPLCVLDTKYKRGENNPSNADIYQVSFYAGIEQCSEAILVYPDVSHKSFDQMVNNIRIRTATFSLAGDLEASGNAFLDSILESYSVSQATLQL